MSSNTRNNASSSSRTTRPVTRQQTESEAREARPTRRYNRLPLAPLSPNIRTRSTGPIYHEDASSIRIRVPDSLSPEPEPSASAFSTSYGELVRRASAGESCQTSGVCSSRGVQKGKRPREDDSGSVENSSSAPFNKRSRFLKGQDRTIELKQSVVDCICPDEFMLVFHHLRCAYKWIDGLDKTIVEQEKTINALLVRIQNLEALHASGSGSSPQNKGKAKAEDE
ncbi:hypothetical protein BX616_005450 [Lobosporangium transversale]|uniref:Uncharacterized protein n=1 Tax=Lobosporangium transversale TaxID=64571 RepID=A0A1Y2FZD4_9FUNG|nr:hypothetical protein BCR41DRAFT_19266 [Lobosporangium transversale]KAF9897527.1 hypothetical protein BX616_005450 [Lobosporangium transversale]ORY89530.1 hypothetical protein BCR41DRAFT_19266 [Lobosporangium transversale]|eukprot:XP_021875062.1 hypothetical protein BCR41DRAFT_19266 [Lobosporangium transversale]